MTEGVPAPDAAPTAVLTEPLREALTALDGEAREVSLRIHGLAETAYREHGSAAALADLLERHRFRVARGVAGLDTAFVAEQGDAGPVVAFVCEYDALPGLGHACGHNLIGTGSAGAGIALAAVLRDRGVAARVRVVGAPAEESGGGKIALARAGAFADVDAALIFHPSDRTSAVLHALACTHWDAVLEPAPNAWGVPLDAFAQTYTSLALLRRDLREGTRVHGCLLEGGAPDGRGRVTAQFITRAREHDYLQGLDARFRAAAEAAAAVTGCRLTLARDEGYRDLRSNPVLARRCAHHLDTAGLAPAEHRAWDRAASTDVGNLSYAAPTLHPEIAITDPGVMYHTHPFREAAATPRAHDAMLRGALALALTGADVVLDARVRTAVRDAFAAEPGRDMSWCGSGA